MAKYIDPFTDTGFKIIFGKEHESNEILRQFLNALFENDPWFNHIESVEYRPSERTREWSAGKSIVYDIFCETSTGHKFIVEMQKHPQEYFLSRAVYYLCRAIADQGYKGKQDPEKRDRMNAATLSSDSATSPETYWDYNVVPVVGVFFSNFHILGLKKEKLVTQGALLDIETKEPIGDYMRYVFIQLPAFSKKADQCLSKLEEWIYNLKHMKTMEAMQFTSHQDIFNRLARVGNLATLSPAERSMYEYDLKKARDYHAELSYARKRAMIKGREEGRAEGRAEGMEEGKLEIARNMIKSGVPLDDIVLWTGISRKMLETLG